MAKRKSYAEKLKDPRWQKKRLEIFERDEWACCICHKTEETLNLHHGYYESGKDPWDYDNDTLWTLCDHHHKIIHEGLIELHKAIGRVRPGHLWLHRNDLIESFENDLEGFIIRYIAEHSGESYYDEK